MKVRVEACWAGNSRYAWRLSLQGGSRFQIRREQGENWSRAAATRALDLLQAEGYAREKIRFDTEAA